MDDMARECITGHCDATNMFERYYKAPIVPDHSTVMRAFFGRHTYIPPGKEMYHTCYPLVRSISIDPRLSPPLQASDEQDQEQQQPQQTDAGERSSASDDTGQGDGPNLTANKNVMERGVSWWNLLAVLLAIHMGHETGIPGIGGPTTKGQPDEQQDKSSQQFWTIEIQNESGRRFNLLWQFPGDMMAIYESLIPVTMGPPGPCQCSPYVAEHESY